MIYTHAGSRSYPAPLDEVLFVNTIYKGQWDWRKVLECVRVLLKVFRTLKRRLSQSPNYLFERFLINNHSLKKITHGSASSETELRIHLFSNVHFAARFICLLLFRGIQMSKLVLYCIRTRKNHVSNQTWHCYTRQQNKTPFFSRFCYN